MTSSSPALGIVAVASAAFCLFVPPAFATGVNSDLSDVAPRSTTVHPAGSFAANGAPATAAEATSAKADNVQAHARTKNANGGNPPVNGRPDSTQGSGTR